MARAITAPELVKLRSDNQVSQRYLVIDAPPIVFQAQVNQTFNTKDKIAKITYDNGSGTLANVLPGMTMWVGSAPNTYDLGQCRIRKTPSASIMYIGEISEIAWANDLHLTVVDEFGIWARPLVVKRDKTVLMDYDITYSNQHTATAPVPVLGTDRVVWLTGATVTVAFDASSSWCLASGSKTYSWSAPGASATSGLATATPSITYNAAGRYRVSCTVTVGSVSTTSYRWVNVYSAASMPVTDFKVTQAPRGAWETGSYEFEIEMYSDTASIRDRAKVILFSRDYYAGVEGSIGPLVGAENIICMGWIDGESITTDPRTGKVSFTIQGPQYWLSKITAFPVGHEIVGSTSAVKAWTQFAGLTVDKTLWHLLYWRSTLMLSTDCTLTGDTRLATALEAPTGDLWSQMTTIASESIFAHPCCDRYGRLFVNIDSQLTPASGRAGFPEVLAVTTADVLGEVAIRRVSTARVSRVNLSGVAVSGSKGKPLFSLSPGHVFKRYGSPLVIERMLLSSQAQANSLAGLVLGNENKTREYEFELAANNRMIDICPPQYLTISRTTLRGVISERVVPREVAYSFKGSSITARIVAECENIEQQSCNGDIPVDPDSTTQEPIEISVVVPPIVIPPPPLIVTGGTVNLVYVLVNSELGAGIYYTTNFQDAIPVWYPMHVNLDALHVPRQIWAASNGAVWAFDAINVYYGPYPGAPWQIVASYDTLQAQFGVGTTNEWQGMGIDRSTGNVLVISDGGFWHGNSTGLTMSLASYADIELSIASFGLGKWRARRYHWLFGNKVLLINAGVTAVEVTSPEYPIFGYYTFFETYDGFYYIINGTSIGRVTNNDIASPVGITLPYTLDTYSSQAWQGIGVDLTGQYLAYPNGDNLRVSSDFGATWATKTLPAWGYLDNRFQLQRIGSSQIVFHQQHNAATGEAAILYSADGGTTWADKTGNFSAITQSARAIPVMLRAVTAESI